MTAWIKSSWFFFSNSATKILYLKKWSHASPEYTFYSHQFQCAANKFIKGVLSIIKDKLLVSIKIANCRSKETTADSVIIDGDNVLAIKKRYIIKLDPYLHNSLHSKILQTEEIFYCTSLPFISSIYKRNYRWIFSPLF